jgi:hypothetical protein
MTDISDEVAALPRDEFAETRSHEAVKTSYDFSKAAAQAGLIINGGAATAVIALLAKDKVEPIIFKIVPWCLTIYAIGVAASAIMMYCAMMHADNGISIGITWPIRRIRQARPRVRQRRTIGKIKYASRSGWRWRVSLLRALFLQLQWPNQNRCQ